MTIEEKSASPFKYLTIVKSNQTKQKSLNNKFHRKEIEKEYVIMILHYVICMIIVSFPSWCRSGFGIISKGGWEEIKRRRRCIFFENCQVKKTLLICVFNVYLHTKRNIQH